MTNILSLRDIADYCARRTGRTSSLIDHCLYHLEHGEGTIGVICLNWMMCDRFIHSIKDKVDDPFYCTKNRIVGGTRRSEIRDRIVSGTRRSEIRVCVMEEMEYVFCGLNLKDVMFDTPEYDIFDMKKLESTIARLSRDS